MKRDYSRNGKIAYQTNIVGELIDQGKYNLAYKVIEELLPDYSEDDRLNFQRAVLKMIEKKYDEAITIIEGLNEDRNFIPLTELYLLLGYEEKAYAMYKKYFLSFRFDNQFFVKDKRYRMLFIYLNRKYTINFKLPSFLGVNYLEQQIYSYDKEKALKKIKVNHVDASELVKGIFNSDVNIEEIYEYADKFIRNTDMIGDIDHGAQLFRFSYPDCGIVRSGLDANGFTVAISLGDKNIIAIYPSRFRNITDCIEYKNNRNDTKKLVRSKSGLERFNARYNK